MNFPLEITHQPLPKAQLKFFVEYFGSLLLQIFEKKIPIFTPNAADLGQKSHTIVFRTKK